MSVHTIEKPRLSPIQFSPSEITFDDRYHVRHIGQTMFHLSIREWEERVKYLQKYQFNDRIQLQFHTTEPDPGNPTPDIKLMDTAKKILDSFNPISLTVLAGNLAPHTGAQLYTWQFSFSFNDVVSLPPGIYFLIFTVVFPGDDVRKEFSEPIYVRADHPGTILLQGANTTNDYNAVFEQTAAQFFLRVEGDINKLKPDATFDSFISQKRRYKKLSGEQDRSFTLSIGGGTLGKGVPDYLLDKIDAMTILDHWRVDGKEFVRDGSKWEKHEIENVPLSTATMVVREADPDESTFTTSVAPLEILTFPVAYPWGIASAKIGIGAPYIEILPAASVIVDATARAQLITDLTAGRTALGLTGTYSDTGGKLVYAPGVGEFFQAASAVLLPEYFTYDFATSGFSYNTQIDLKGGGYALVNWGGGTVEAQKLLPTFYTPFTHAYAGPATRTVQVFHNHGITAVYLNEPATSSFSGVMSSALEQYANVATGMLMTGFDVLMFAPCLNLQSFVCQTGLTGLTNSYPSPWNNCSYFNFSGNNFSSSIVGALIFDVHSGVAANNVHNGFLTVKYQVPTAPPNFLGVTYKAILITTYGWTVQND